MKEDYLHRHLPYGRQLGDGLIDLRGDGILTGYAMIGPSPEVSAGAHLGSCVDRIATALTTLGTGDSLWAIYHRTPAPVFPTPIIDIPAARMVYEDMQAQYAGEQHWITPTRLYLAYHYGSPVKTALQAYLLGADIVNQHAHQRLLRDRALGRFAAFRDAAASGITLAPLTSEQLVRDLAFAVTYDDTPVAPPESHVMLNRVLASDRWQGGMTPYVNGWHLRPLCIMTYPGETVPQMLAVLLKKPGHMTLCVRYLCRDPYDAQQELETEKKHWRRTFLENFRKVWRRYFKNGQNAEDDTDAIEQIAALDESKRASMQGMSFGRCTVTAIIRDRNAESADQRASDLRRELSGMGITSYIEDYKAATAIQGTWPGNWATNRRSILMTGPNFASLMLPASYWQGTPHIDSELYPPNTPTPLVAGGGGSRPPFFWPTHINGVGNQLVIGPSGSGKSTLELIQACMYLSIPNSRVYILDVGYSSYIFTHLMGGEYHDVGAEDGLPLRPLDLLDKPGGQQWLLGWFERMFASEPGIYGIGKFELDERQREDFKYALRRISADPDKRSLDDLRALIPGGEGGRNRIRRILEEYISDYGHIFGRRDEQNNGPSTSRLVTYDVQALMGTAEHIATAAMELLLQFIFSNLDGNPTFIMADEFWSLLQNERSARWLNTAIRTLRRRNAAFIGYTQSTEELAASPYCNLFLESCPGLVLLPNHRARSEYVAQAYRRFGLDPHETACIANAQPHADYYFTCAMGSRLVRLELGEVARSICASTSYADVKRFRSERHNLDSWLRRDTAHLPGVYSAAAG